MYVVQMRIELLAHPPSCNRSILEPRDCLVYKGVATYPLPFETNRDISDRHMLVAQAQRLSLSTAKRCACIPRGAGWERAISLESVTQMLFPPLQG